MTTTLPRLTSALQWQAILSMGEARSAIQAHRDGDGIFGGSEAVVHYGGATALIRDAFRNRGVMVRRALAIPDYMTVKQCRTIQRLWRRFNCESPVDLRNFVPAFDLPTGYVCGWIGGDERKLYVGISREGEASS